MAWWTAGGASGIVAAYQPIGAASLAASYVNLANPGTYDAAPGVAPTFDVATGWTFNGSTQYLATGIPADQKPVAILARVAVASAGTYRIIYGPDGSGGIDLYRFSGNGKIELGKGGVALIGTSTSTVPADGTSFVTAATYSGAGAYAFYLNGSADGAGTNDQSFTAGRTAWIGREGGFYYAGTVAALAVYNTVLDAATVAAVSAAMAALPDTGSAVASIVQAHGLYLGASLGGA